jgi:hypothetical protein
VKRGRLFFLSSTGSPTNVAAMSTSQLGWLRQPSSSDSMAVRSSSQQTP